MTSQTFAIEGLSCEGCVDTVRQGLLVIDGISGVEVALNGDEPSSVRIEASQAVAVDQLQRALDSVGSFRIRS